MVVLVFKVIVIPKRRKAKLGQRIGYGQITRKPSTHENVSEDAWSPSGNTRNPSAYSGNPSTYTENISAYTGNPLAYTRSLSGNTKNPSRYIAHIGDSKARNGGRKLIMRPLGPKKMIAYRQNRGRKQEEEAEERHRQHEKEGDASTGRTESKGGS